MEEIVSIKNLKEGEKVWIRGRFYKKSLKTKNGDLYHLVKIKDVTGVAMQQVWSNLDIAPAIENLKDNDLVEAEVVLAKNGKFRNIYIYNIARIDAIDAQEPKKQDEYGFEDAPIINEVMAEISEPYKQLLHRVFEHPVLRRNLLTSPASMMSGYSYRGGLVEHVLRLTRLVKAIIPIYEELGMNKDILFVGCILHDIGKVFVYKEKNGRLEKTYRGELFEDSYVTLRFLIPIIEESSLSREEKVLLEHVIGATKGRPEYGALHLPRSKEAVMLHYLDALDVQMANFEHLMREANGEKFVKLFQKTMFLGF